MFLAQPKCASTRFRSWVANAIFIPRAPRWFSMSRNRRLNCMAGLRQRPRFRSIYVRMCQKEIADLEQELARAPIAQRDAVSRAQAIEHRQPRAMKWNMQSLGRLPAVRVGDHQIAPDREPLQIFQIADQNLLRRDEFEQRGLRGRDRGANLRAELAQAHCQRPQQIRLRADDDARAADEKMRIEHGILQLAALPSKLQRYRRARNARELHHE